MSKISIINRRVVRGVGHLDHVWSYGVRKVVSSIPDRGNIVPVGWVFHPTRWVVRFPHLNTPFLQRRSQDFCLGGATRYIFRHLSGSRPHSVGGVVAKCFRDLSYRIRFGGGGGSSKQTFFPLANQSHSPRFLGIFGTSGTFSGHLRIARRLWTLTEIQAHFTGLLTHSNHVTTSIHSRKKHLTRIWGAMAAMAPLAPPLATPLLSLKILNLFRTLSSWGSGNYRPSSPFLYEVARPR